MEEIFSLLARTIGLDPDSIGRPAIERATRLRTQACGSRSTDDYLQFLRRSPSELQHLIEAVVVPETWFFRDPNAFVAVTRLVASRPSQRSYRFLCIPCSTGEEPYSLAMALLDAGLAPTQFTVDAVDVSQRVLTRAEAGVYGRNSFRGDDLAYRGRHFTPAAEAYVLNAGVRERVQLIRGNLLVDATLPLASAYDAVFCRNLLIYLDAESQRRALKTLERFLAPHGLLCVGPAEAALLTSYEFTPEPLALSFAFRKGKTKPAAAPPPRPIPMASAPIRRSKPIATPMKAVIAPATPTASSDLSAAARMADEGRFSEVVAICSASLRESGPSAEAYYLLGLVSDAVNRGEEAASYYRKALYLDPHHEAALLHYAILTARRGDSAAARALRARASRCEANAVK